jgi:cytochrome c biogenesis protein CcmG, thiol:disulfide interchange protein DsbE
MDAPSTVLRWSRRALPWVLLFVGVFWFSRNVRPTASFAVGERLPAISAELSDGTHLSLDGVRAPGQVLVLNFWASYCAPCRTEAPLLSAAHARGVRVVGLSVDSDNDEMRKAVRALGINYPVGRSDDAIVKRFHLRSVPTTYVLAPSGAIVLSRVGAVTKDELDAALQSAKSQG